MKWKYHVSTLSTINHWFGTLCESWSETQVGQVKWMHLNTLLPHLLQTVASFHASFSLLPSVNSISSRSYFSPFKDQKGHCQFCVILTWHTILYYSINSSSILEPFCVPKHHSFEAECHNINTVMYYLATLSFTWFYGNWGSFKKTFLLFKAWIEPFSLWKANIHQKLKDHINSNRQRKSPLWSLRHQEISPD